MIKKIAIIIIFVFVSIILSVCVGSVFISPTEIISIFIYKIFNLRLIDNIGKMNTDIIFSIRVPHAVLSFFCRSISFNDGSSYTIYIAKSSRFHI